MYSLGLFLVLLRSLKVFVSPRFRLVEKNEHNNNGSLLKEWCKQLIKTGDEKESHFKSVLDMTILDILACKEVVSSMALENVKKSYMTEHMIRGEKEKFPRQQLEEIVEKHLQNNQTENGKD